MKKKGAQVAISPEAFDLLYENMGEEGHLEKDLRVSLTCVRGTWIVDAEERAGGDGMTLPAGYDMRAISSLVRRFVRETRSDDHAMGWRMPPLSTAYLCDDGRMRTVGQMLEGVSVDLMPRDEVDFDTLMVCFGCDWTHPLSPTMHPRGALRQGRTRK